MAAADEYGEPLEVTTRTVRVVQLLARRYAIAAGALDVGAVEGDVLLRLAEGQYRAHILNRQVRFDVIDLIRAQRGRHDQKQTSSLSDADLRSLAADDDPAAQIVDRDTFAAARDRMSDRVREMYDLTLTGLSQVEVARQLGISEAAVSNAMSVAREVLRSEIEGDDDGEA